MRHPLTQVSLLCAFAFALSTSCLVSGCLVSGAPPLEGKEQVSPRIVANNISPSPFVVVPTTSQNSTPATSFKVYFWSEDLGENVTGYLYLDEVSEEAYLRQSEVTGGSLSDAEPRSMEIVWAVNRDPTPGCHIIIMVIGHESNFTDKLVPAEDSLDEVTFVTWTIAHDLPPYEISLEDCPQPGVEQGLN